MSDNSTNLAVFFSVLALSGLGIYFLNNNNNIIDSSSRRHRRHQADFYNNNESDTESETDTESEISEEENDGIDDTDEQEVDEDMDAQDEIPEIFDTETKDDEVVPRRKYTKRKVNSKKRKSANY